jgi:hypothetical protein
MRDLSVKVDRSDEIFDIYTVLSDKNQQIFEWTDIYKHIFFALQNLGVVFLTILLMF